MLALKMPFQDYAQVEACNKSSLAEILRSPWHYKYALENERVAKPSQVKGRLAHTLILEPELFSALYYVSPDQKIRRNSNLWSAVEEQAGPRDILKPDELALGQAIRDAVYAHGKARECLQACEHREASLFWDDPETGIKCKARPDALSVVNRVIVDLKTTQDASVGAFSKDVITYKYHWQAAMYTDAAKAEFSDDFLFVFIAVENKAPFGVAVYLLSSEFIEVGRKAYKSALAKVLECRKSGVWPCYSESALELPAPQWLVQKAMG